VPKMVVVDDNISDLEDIQAMVSTIAVVEWTGCYTRPQEALLDMARSAPDVVIAAVEMMEMNGLSFTRKLQEILPGVHVIVAARNDHYAREAYEVGARGYLIKPFEKESLMRLLGKVLS
jgi:two-component SAPR family response regulator